MGDNARSLAKACSLFILVMMLQKAQQFPYYSGVGGLWNFEHQWTPVLVIYLCMSDGKYWYCKKYNHFQTRMHSSRMRTSRSLTVCCSLLPWGVCGPGGVCSRGGCLVWGRVCSQGVLLQGGGGYPSMHWGRHSSPLWTDTHLWKYYLGPTLLRPVTSMHSSRMRTTCLLPVSPSMNCSGGVSVRGVGCVCLLRVCLSVPRGVSAP